MKKVFSNIVIPRIVYYEFENRINNEIKQTIKSLTRSKFVLLEDFDIDSPEYKFYSSLKKGVGCKCIGKCESAAITIAKHDKLTILSNNNCDNFKEHNLETISMIDLLINSYTNDLINEDEAEVIWSNIKEVISYSGNFSDYYTHMIS